MRIDDNERREVAKKLRNLDVRKYDAYRLIPHMTSKSPSALSLMMSIGSRQIPSIAWPTSSTDRSQTRWERAVNFNDVEFKACPRCGIEPAIKDVRVRSLTEPNMMSVTCPACGLSNSIAWGSMGQASLKHAVIMLADSWNSR